MSSREILLNRLLEMERTLLSLAREVSEVRQQVQHVTCQAEAWRLVYRALNEAGMEETSSMRAVTGGSRACEYVRLLRRRVRELESGQHTEET